MGFLEILGGVTILFLIGYGSILYKDKKEKDDKDRSKFIDDCPEAWKLTYRYLESVKSGKPIMSETRYKAQIDSMMSNPIYIKEVENERRRKRNLKENAELERRNNRKVGFKYDVQIFEIFNQDRELKKEELISRMQEKFNDYDLNSIDELFKIWMENMLIQKSSWNDTSYVVGSTLVWGTQIDKDDLSYRKWISDNNIVFKDPSPKHQAFLDKEDDLPF